MMTCTHVNAKHTKREKAMPTCADKASNLKVGFLASFVKKFLRRNGTPQEYTEFSDS